MCTVLSTEHAFGNNKDHSCVMCIHSMIICLERGANDLSQLNMLIITGYVTCSHTRALTTNYLWPVGSETQMRPLWESTMYQMFHNVAQRYVKTEDL